MIGKFLDLIWPRTCEVCGRPVDRPGRHLCSDCVMRLPFVPTDGLCRKCGRDAVGLDGEYLCDDCRQHRPHFDRAASVFRFEGEARELVNAFKFREKLYLRDDLVDFLEAAVRARFRVDEIACVMPIPSTLTHRLLRGYNQCAILAQALAKRLGKPYRPLLRRVGHPEKQGGLDEAARRENVIDTFAPTRSFRLPTPDCRLPVPDSRLSTFDSRLSAPVLVLDDIMTTGSTLSEAARTLKAAGVETVWTVSLARSIRL